MSDDKKSFQVVLSSLSQMRSSLSKAEQDVLDQIILRSSMTDEVSAHSMTNSSAKSSFTITYNVTTGMYERWDY